MLKDEVDEKYDSKAAIDALMVLLRYMSIAIKLCSSQPVEV